MSASLYFFSSILSNLYLEIVQVRLAILLKPILQVYLQNCIIPYPAIPLLPYRSQSQYVASY